MSLAYIDSVRYDIFKSMGWTEINVWPQTSWNMERWIQNNARGQYLEMPFRFLFEFEDDAFMFTLRWGQWLT